MITMYNPAISCKSTSSSRWMVYSYPCPCLSRNRLVLDPCDPMLHCTHTRCGRLRCGRHPYAEGFLSSLPIHRRRAEQRLPHSGGMSANSFPLTCRYSCKSGYADCLRGVLWSVSSDNGRTHNLPISRSRATANISYLLLSCTIPWSSPTVFDHNADKKDSTDNCDSCPASHTDSRHGHFPSLNVSAVDSTTDIVRATQPA